MPPQSRLPLFDLAAGDWSNCGVIQVVVLGCVCAAAATAFNLWAWVFSALRLCRFCFLRLSALGCLDILFSSQWWGWFGTELYPLHGMKR